MSSLFVQASNNKSRYQRDQPAIISNPVIDMNKLVGLIEPKMLRPLSPQPHVNYFTSSAKNSPTKL